MLSRTEPPVSSGLATVRAIHAWQALFGTLLPDEAGIAALDAYHAPDRMPLVSGRLATLFYREMPQQLADMMVRLHYSVRETDAARQALTAMQAILSGQCTLMDAVRFGTAPIAHGNAQPYQYNAYEQRLARRFRIQFITYVTTLPQIRTCLTLSLACAFPQRLTSGGIIAIIS